MKTIGCGVPQGSILGPLLFLIYINDLATVSKHLMSILFADDTNMFNKGKNALEMQTIINEELEKVTLWLKVNKLSLNIKKTHFMVFSNKPTCNMTLDIRIDGHQIKEVDKTKFLGVYIDNKLTWKDHIKFISGKLSRGIGMVIKARKFLDKASLINIYYSFFYPYITYCNHIWGNASKSYLNRIFILQKKIVRIISHEKRLAPTAQLFDKLGLIKFTDLNKYIVARFMFRWYNNETPSMFHNYFTLNHDVHNYRTRQAEYLHIPSARTNLGKKSIRFHGAIIWNKLLKLDFSVDTSEAVFVKNLKRCLRGGML